MSADSPGNHLTVTINCQDGRADVFCPSIFFLFQQFRSSLWKMMRMVAKSKLQNELWKPEEAPQLTHPIEGSL